MGRPRLTDEERAQRARDYGRAYYRRCKQSPLNAAKRLNRQRERYREDNPPERSRHVTSAGVPPPAQVLAERDAALSAQQSLTALVLGDPPAGRSALDQKRREGLSG